MVGQADVITPPESNLEIAAAIPAASVHVVPGAGHALYLEKPAEFNRLVSDFAATRSAG
jgi:pimeloyl-ACP methyl ester carboxylesterase